MNLLIWPERLLFRQERRSKEKGMDDSDRAQAVMERGSERALCNRLTRKRRADVSARTVAERSPPHVLLLCRMPSVV